MNQEEIEQFRKEFKSILYINSKIKGINISLKKLHVWDKNGSHENAILKELENKKIIQIKLKESLKGIDYEEWKRFSKNLSILMSKVKNNTTQKEKIEQAINNLTFKL